MYDSTISRNEGWNFGKLGQVLERADNVKSARLNTIICLSRLKQVGSSLDLIGSTFKVGKCVRYV
jgi:uncharacterized alpha-E superfamily protein